jgi:hypothetical protein
VIRRVKSPLGRLGLRVLLFLLAILVTCLPVGILGSSNLVWGEDNQYGRVDVPGTLVPVVAAALVTAGTTVWFLITRLIRRRGPVQSLVSNRPQWQERSEYES